MVRNEIAGLAILVALLPSGCGQAPAPPPTPTPAPMTEATPPTVDPCGPEPRQFWADFEPPYSLAKSGIAQLYVEASSKAVVITFLDAHEFMIRAKPDACDAGTITGRFEDNWGYTGAYVLRLADDPTLEFVDLGTPEDMGPINRIGSYPEGKVILISGRRPGDAECPVTEDELVGAWSRVGEDGYFEEFTLRSEGGGHMFDSYLHHRPDLFGADWLLRDCRLVIRPRRDEMDPFHFDVVGFDNGQLRLHEWSEDGVATYSRLP